ncbi:methyltransferase [Allosaccharopolyspora coralli]|uniref:Methyltransferase n=1 Tax=Allosaccharopolyspora coralli TaxID=2665642 RepID=A0A5Q3QEQ3_9PSEU|nr:class I SAM-dependent methyltransferase [Allosaccharopolyspora coralli]QGK69939.1 methyltransferase [Allosaccharopolyspora coralli]
MRSYQPTGTPQEQEAIRRWHEAAYAELRARDTETVSYFDFEFVVPPTVFPPQPVSHLLGRSVLAETRATDRVLDLGTGSGVNAVLAASISDDVLGVDVNPDAVDCARANAERNGLAARFRQSDLFDGADGRFDLVVFDPPFRWFPARDMLERATTDEDYATMRRFAGEVGAHLAPGGRVLLFFGTSGDLGYLDHLIDETSLRRETVATETLHRADTSVDYVVYRLTTP